MYSIASYGKMIADCVRMDAYMQALDQAVKPGAVVVDIGTGTGIFALQACRLGARRVYAIEPGDAIQVARDMAADNGYAERIQCLQKLSTRVTLPEPANVIVSDLRGVLPLFGQHLPAIIDARQRLLAADGILIPQRDTLWAAIVEAPALYRHHLSSWDANRYGFDTRSARRIVLNTWCKARITPEQLLVEPQSWATLDYSTLTGSDVRAEVTWVITRAGIGHGVGVWFDTTLLEGVGFSNAPQDPELIYSNAFFPWDTPVTLAVGDRVCLGLQADLVGEDYVWRWQTRVWGKGKAGHVKADFIQSTFFGQPLSLAQLRKGDRAYIPTLNEDGQIDRCILALMDGQTPLSDIVQQITEQFPARFATCKDALTHIGELSCKYGQ